MLWIWCSILARAWPGERPRDAIELLEAGPNTRVYSSLKWRLAAQEEIAQLDRLAVMTGVVDEDLEELGREPMFREGMEVLLEVHRLLNKWCEAITNVLGRPVIIWPSMRAWYRVVGPSGRNGSSRYNPTDTVVVDAATPGQPAPSR